MFTQLLVLFVGIILALAQASRAKNAEADLHESIQHEQDVWSTAYIRMDGNWEDKVALVLVAVCEGVLPDLLDFACGYPAVRVGCVLDEPVQS